MAAVNSYALEKARVDRKTPDPRGGRFDRDADGEPTGVLRESARDIVLRAGPDPPRATVREELTGIQAC